MKHMAYILLLFGTLAATLFGFLSVGLYYTLLAIYVTLAVAYILWQMKTGDLSE